MPDEPALLTSAEVADLFRVHRQTVHRWAAEGVLVPVNIPGRVLKFRREDVLAMLKPREGVA